MAPFSHFPSMHNTQDARVNGLYRYQIPTHPVAFIGLFMEQLLIKFSRTLDQDLDMNLVLTGLFAKLCYYPTLSLTMYLLNYQPNVASGVLTLYSCIEKVFLTTFYFKRLSLCTVVARY